MTRHSWLAVRTTYLGYPVRVKHDCVEVQDGMVWVRFKHMSGARRYCRFVRRMRHALEEAVA